jgi:hypothetical protein
VPSLRCDGGKVQSTFLGFVLAVAGTRVLARLESLSIPLPGDVARMRRRVGTLMLAIMTGIVSVSHDPSALIRRSDKRPRPSLRPRFVRGSRGKHVVTDLLFRGLAASQ